MDNADINSFFEHMKNLNNNSQGANNTNARPNSGYNNMNNNYNNHYNNGYNNMNNSSNGYNNMNNNSNGQTNNRNNNSRNNSNNNNKNNPNMNNSTNNSGKNCKFDPTAGASENYCKNANSDMQGGFQDVNPELFIALGDILGMILSCNMPFNVQNAFGNWLQLIGQAILTYNAQQQYFMGGPGRYFDPVFRNINNPFYSPST